MDLGTRILVSISFYYSLYVRLPLETYFKEESHDLVCPSVYIIVLTCLVKAFTSVMMDASFVISQQSESLNILLRNRNSVSKDLLILDSITLFAKYTCISIVYQPYLVLKVFACHAKPIAKKCLQIVHIPNKYFWYTFYAYGSYSSDVSSYVIEIFGKYLFNHGETFKGTFSHIDGCTKRSILRRLI